VRFLLALAILALAALAACTSGKPRARDDGGIPALAGGETSRPEPPKPAPACPTEPLPGPACRHVWQQVAVHPWTHVVNDLPMADMCVVSQCPKCGAVRHDCERRRR
jgi:hypothetical protein